MSPSNIGFVRHVVCEECCLSPVRTDHNDRNSCAQTTNLCRIDAPQFAVHVLTIPEEVRAHFGVCGVFRRGALQYVLAWSPCLCALTCVCCERPVFLGEEREIKRKGGSLFCGVSLWSVSLCVRVCVYVNQPLVSWRQMKQCASIRGSQNTHYPPRLFLYSHLCLALPLPHRPPNHCSLPQPF